MFRRTVLDLYVFVCNVVNVMLGPVLNYHLGEHLYKMWITEEERNEESLIFMDPCIVVPTQT